MYMSNGYRDYAPHPSGEVNPNVQMFARDSFVPTTSYPTKQQIDTDIAYTDSFRGGSSFSSSSSSSSSPSPYESAQSPQYYTYDSPPSSPYDTPPSDPQQPYRMGTDSIPYPYPQHFDYDSQNSQQYSSDSSGTYGAYNGPPQNSPGPGSYPSSYPYAPEPQRDQGNMYGKAQNPYGNIGPGSYPESISGYQEGNGFLGIRKTFIKGKTWEEKKSLVRSMSVFGHLPGDYITFTDSL